ncbi:Na+/H+ antiporter-like protein [Staphylococcus aureus]|nr:Na+/H+ antiporter-like protein [Staphylococcus aureus]
MSLTVKIEVSLIGKNQLTIPIAQNLTSQLYDVTLYYRKDLSDRRQLSDDITMIEIADYEQDVLERLGLFDRDIVVVLRMTMILTEKLLN